MPAVAEFITRVNYILRFGRFVMDYRDGEISFRTGLVCGEGNVPDADLIIETIYMNVALVDAYGDALLSVLFGFDTPEDAFNKCD